MLPQFPQTKILELSDKPDVEAITSRFLPYSDYYFFSLWTWNIHDQTSISSLNGNLVVLFHDYETNEPFLSFIGDNTVFSTIETLLSYSREHGLKKELHLIPTQVVLPDLNELSNSFDIQEDRDSFDYVFLTEKLIDFESPALYTKKKTLNRFLREHASATVEIVPLNDPSQLQLLNELRSTWSGQKGDVNSFETHAEERVSLGLAYFRMQILIVKEFQKIIGYVVFEVVNSVYAISSFQRGDRSCVGVYEYMNRELCIFLSGQGITYVNVEQDAGVPGLRQSKLAYDPTFLKKYTIKLKE